MYHYSPPLSPPHPPTARPRLTRSLGGRGQDLGGQAGAHLVVGRDVQLVARPADEPRQRVRGSGRVQLHLGASGGRGNDCEESDGECHKNNHQNNS